MGMCLVESRTYFKKHSVDRMCYRWQGHKLVSEYMYTDPAVKQFLVHSEHVLLGPQDSAGSVDPLQSVQRNSK